jgi:hypothetical protein
MNTKLKSDLGVGIIVYSLVIVFFSQTFKMPAQASLFPRMVLALMAFLNTAMLIMAFRANAAKKNTGSSGVTWQMVKMPLLYFAGIVAYCVLFKFMGYFPSTAIALIAFFVISKVRPYWLITAITAGYLVFTYLLFVLWLKVPII